MNLWRSNEEIQALLDEVSEELKMTTSYVDPQGTILLNGGTHNPLCALIRDKEDSLKFICSLTSQRMLKEVEKTKESLIDFCELGLLRFVVPIFADEGLVGAFTGCGTGHPEESIDSFYVAKQLGIEEDKAEGLIETVQGADLDKVKQAVVKIEAWIDEKS
ncbi:MAG: PocR ligand-binding domain-containing protein [Deltaproteobacteria bacterium]|nr:PocR ligand-binding domain-containing protein [Deltaproteobacteria bacterium]MBW2086433.1 PocR ligand-binding domain-containing protein [Deltaproteobacteria bacterium]